MVIYPAVLPVAVYAGFPLTEKSVGRSFLVASAHQPQSLDWSSFHVDTLVLLMGGSSLLDIVQSLRQNGWSPEMPARLHFHWKC